MFTPRPSNLSTNNWPEALIMPVRAIFLMFAVPTEWASQRRATRVLRRSAGPLRCDGTTRSCAPKSSGRSSFPFADDGYDLVSQKRDANLSHLRRLGFMHVVA